MENNKQKQPTYLILIPSLVMLLFFLVVYYNSSLIEGVPGRFPRLVGVLGIVFSLVDVIVKFISSKKRGAKLDFPYYLQVIKSFKTEAKFITIVLLGFSVLILVTLWISFFAGVLAASPVFFVGAGLKKPHIIIAGSVINAAVVTYIFTNLLNVPLP